MNGNRIERVRIERHASRPTGDRAVTRSGFCTIVGRPNVGKSTLLNRILGTKVSIVSDKPQTTRTQVRGVLDRPDAQVVFVDTPGHPQAPDAARRAAQRHGAPAPSATSTSSSSSSTPPAKVGRGDEWVADRVPRDALLVVNKVDTVAPRARSPSSWPRAAELDLDEYFPISARTGDGVAALVEAIVARMPEGPRYYPEGTVTDVPEAFWVAELVREQLLAVAREELPHSIATRCVEWEWPRDPRRDPRRARQPEGDRDRQGRLGAQGRSAPRCASSCPRAPSSSCS